MSDTGKRFVYSMLVEQCRGNSPRDRANSRRFFNWTLALAASMLVTTFVLKRGLISGPLTIPIAAITPLVAVMAMRAYYVLVSQADEMLRKIHLQAFSFGFAGGLLYFFAVSALRLLDIAVPDPDIMATVMMLSWAFGQFLAARRYL